MATHRKQALAQLANDLQQFGSEVTGELQELRRNVEIRPVTRPTTFRHCLEDLTERLNVINEDVTTLESVSLDAISLEELVGHCTAVYQHNHRAIAALESRLQDFGFSQTFAPAPPADPLAPAPAVAPTPLAGQATDEAAAGMSPLPSLPSPHAQPPPSLSCYGAATAVVTAPDTALRPLTAAAAMAPMTAVKAKFKDDDTPSSLAASPEALTPSMRQLLGKYAGADSSEGGFSGLSGLTPRGLTPRSARRGAILHTDPSGATPTVAATVPPSPLPLPLSPAFVQAAEQHRSQMEEASAVDAAAGYHTVAGGAAAAVHHVQHEQEPASLASNPDYLLDLYRSKYPHVVASIEKGEHARGGGVGSAAAANLKYSTGSGHPVVLSQYHPAVAAAVFPAPSPGPSYPDEESTMELKAQVIYSRARAQQQQAAAAAAAAAAVTPASAVQAGPIPSTAALMHRAMDATTTTTTATTASAAAPPTFSSAMPSAGAHTDSLEQAIAAALGRPSTAFSTRSATSGGSSSSAGTAGNPTPAVTPATEMLRSGAMSARTLPSARGPSSLTPSLPLSVAPLREVDAADYSTLPAFIRGQLPLEQLNSAAAAVHADALRRCAAGDGASFSMDDVEAAGALPAGKGKVLINALAKLGHVQLKVVYGQGTVYFFA